MDLIEELPMEYLGRFPVEHLEKLMVVPSIPAKLLREFVVEDFYAEFPEEIIG